MIEPLLPSPFTTSSSSSSSSSKGKTNSLPGQRQSPEMGRTTERKKSISMKKRGLHLNTGNTSNHHSSHNTSESQTKTSSNPNHNTSRNSSSGGGGVSSSRGTGKSNLPPRPPPPLQQPVWIDPLERSNAEQQQPPSHLQCGSSEDLSFADFSAMEDSMDDCYTNSNNSVNDSYHNHNNSYSNDYHHHHNNAFLDGSTPGKSSKSRVNAIDVASVGNASDTMVVQESRHESASLENHHPHHNNSNNNSPQMMVVATRDLHEKAKMAFNAEKYHEALPLFESILSAQVRRFSSTIHPSVGAAMHNVGVRCNNHCQSCLWSFCFHSTQLIDVVSLLFYHCQL